MSAKMTLRRIMVSFALLALATGCAQAEGEARNSTVEVLDETSENTADEASQEDYRLQVECQLASPTMEPC